MFGYGSLIYNPIIEHRHRAIASTYGYHRRFCLLTNIGRESPDDPGSWYRLIEGVVQRYCLSIEPVKHHCRAEITVRNEIMTLAYQPSLLSLHTDIGLKRGLALVADPARPVYAPRMPIEATVEVPAHSAGFNGPCRNYLYETVKGMQAFGIRDLQLEKLAAAVQHRLASY